MPAAIDDATWLQHAWRNRLQSIVLLVSMALFLALLGHLLWGVSGLLMLLMIGIMVVLFNPVLSPRLVMRMYGARPVGAAQVPMLASLISDLSVRAGLPQQPDLYYIPSRMLNAFAVGSRQAPAIALTDGLLRRLSTRELAGVLAHEISHIRSNDLWVMGLADMFSRATSLLSLMGQLLLLLNLPLILFTELTINWFAILLLVFAPSISALAQLALSRTREYDADLGAVRLTGDPHGLARALAVIEQVQGGWFERIFMPGRRMPEPSVLRTHPETRQRIERLLALTPAASAPFSSASNTAVQTDAGKLFGARVRRRLRWHLNGLWH